MADARCPRRSAGAIRSASSYRGGNICTDLTNDAAPGGTAALQTLPSDVFEAARIDGCSDTAVLLRVVLPLVGPGLAVSVILCFVFAWNYFLFSLVLSDIHSRTLIVAAFNFVGEGVTDWGALMAAATLIGLPPVLVTWFGQRWLVAGLTAGAVKG